MTPSRTRGRGASLSRATVPFIAAALICSHAFSPAPSVHATPPTLDPGLSLIVEQAPVFNAVGLTNYDSLGLATGCGPCGCEEVQSSVNLGDATVLLHSGQEVFTEEDAFLSGRDQGVDFRVLRRHVTRRDSDKAFPRKSGGAATVWTPFSPAWSSNYRHVFWLEVDSTSATANRLHLDGFGRSDTFRPDGTPDPNGEGVYAGSDSERQESEGRVELAQWELKSGSTTEGTLTMRRANGTTLVYAGEQEPGGSDYRGHLIEVRSPNANRVKISYDATPTNILERRISHVIDSFDRRINFNYGVTHDFVTSILEFPDLGAPVTGVSRTWTYTYDAAGGSNYALDTVTTPAVTDGVNNFTGKTREYAYRRLGSAGDELYYALTSVTYPREVASSGSPRFTWTYNETAGLTFGFVTGHEIGKATEGGGAFSYVYSSIDVDTSTLDENTAISTVTVTNRRGVKIETKMNYLGQMLEEKVKANAGLDGSRGVDHTRSFTYNADGLLLTETKPLGNTVTYTYSSARRLEASNQLTKTIAGDGVRATDHAAIVHTWAYEPVFNRKMSYTDPRGFDTVYDFDYMENLSAAATALADGLFMTPAALSTLFTNRGLPSLGDLNGNGFQPCGNVIRVTYETVARDGDAIAAGFSGTQDASVLYTYDAFGRRTKMVDAEENVTEWGYNASSNPDGASLVTVTGVTGNGGFLASMSVDTTGGGSRNNSSGAAAINAVTTYSYGSASGFPGNPRGVPTKIVDPRGIETHRNVNELDQVVEEVRAAAVPASGPFSSLTAFGYTTTTVYDANDQVIETRVTDSGNPSGTSGEVRTTYSRDLLDFVTEIVEDADNLAITTTYEYDNETSRTVMVRGSGTPAASRTEWTYDERNIVYSELRGAGGSGGSENAMMTTEVDLNGNITKRYDAIAGASGTKTSLTNPTAGNATVYEYDGFDRLLEITDREGLVTKRTYDPAGNVVRVTATGDIRRPGVSAFSELLTDERYTFDERNRQERVDRLVKHYTGVGSGTIDGGSLGGSVTHSGDWVSELTVFDRLGRVIAQFDAEGDLSEYKFDGKSRMIEALDPIGNTTTNTYDVVDNLLTVVELEVETTSAGWSESFTTDYTYDSLNRRVTLEEPNGQTTTFGYDSRNNLVTTEDAEGNVVEYSHDRLNRLLFKKTYLKTPTSTPAFPSTQSGASNSTPTHILLAQTWDALNRVATAIDDNGNVTEWTYDDLDRVLSIEYGDSTVKSWTYTADGEALTHTDQIGTVWNYTFDLEGRRLTGDVTSVAGTIGTENEQAFESGQADLEYFYDDLGRSWGDINRNGPDVAPDADDVVTTRWLDSLGRTIREHQVAGVFGTSTVSFGWLGNRRLVRTTYPNARVVTRTYDALDRLSEIWDESTSPRSQVMSKEYVGKSRDLKVTYGNGTVLDKLDTTGSGTIGTDGGYDSNRRHARHAWDNSGGTNLFEYINTYNDANRRESEERTHTGNTDSYAFDSAYRMWGFERNGSIVSTRTLDGADKMRDFDDEGTQRLPVVDGVTAHAGLNQYSSFDSGVTPPVTNRTYSDNGGLHDPGHSNRRYVYNVSNRLYEVYIPGSPRTSIAKYCYDGQHRRVINSTLGVVTRYVYAGWQVLEEQDGLGGTVHQFIDGPGIDEHIQMLDVGDDDRYYYHCNSQGFVGGLTDDTGAVVEVYEYTWLGKPTSGTAVNNPYFWQGRRYDFLTGLYYFRNRFYETETGEFTTIDPSGLWTHGQGNGYSAFAASGWNVGDPFGLDVVDPSVGGGACYSGNECGKGMDGVTNDCTGNCEPSDMLKLLLALMGAPNGAVACACIENWRYLPRGSKKKAFNRLGGWFNKPGGESAETDREGRLLDDGYWGPNRRYVERGTDDCGCYCWPTRVTARSGMPHFFDPIVPENWYTFEGINGLKPNEWMFESPLMMPGVVR